MGGLTTCAAFFIFHVILFTHVICTTATPSASPSTKAPTVAPQGGMALQPELLSQLSNFGMLQNPIMAQVLTQMTGGNAFLGGLAQNVPAMAGRLQGLTESLNTTVSQQCLIDLQHFWNSLTRMEFWAIGMLDAMGKFSPGVLKGATTLVGAFDECLDLSQEVTPDHVINGAYSQIDIKTDLTKLLGPGGAVLGAVVPTLSVHLCLPDSCDSQDLFQIFNETLSRIEIIGNLTAAFVIEKQDPTNDTGFWAAIGVLAFLDLLCTLGTVVGEITDRRERKRQAERDQKSRDIENSHVNPAFNDEVSKEGKEIERSNGAPNGVLKPTHSSLNGTVLSFVSTEPSANGHGNGTCSPAVKKTEPSSSSRASFPTRLLTCFSVLKNGRKLLSCHQGQGDLGCIHGIRVLSMSWVILGHSYILYGTSLGNTSAVVEMAQRWTMTPIANGTLSVDSFFLLSGALTSYVFLRQVKRAGGVSIKTMILYYVHRFWRLTPLYMISLMFYTCVLRYMAYGPFQAPDAKDMMHNCRHYWWRNLLYINNFFSVEEYCEGWSWYLAIDMQLYVIAPIILLPWAFGLRVVGILLSLALLLVHLIGGGYILYGIPVTLVNPNTEKYFNGVYAAPWCRVGPFAIGLILGYILYRCKGQYKLEKLSVCLGWILAIAMGMAAVYCDHDKVKDVYPSYQYSWTQLQSAIYETVMRPLWGAALAWVVFACSTGHGGLVNSLLSWKAWIPLSRLSYGVYLFHLVVLDFFVFNLKQSFFLDAFSMTRMFLAVTVVTFMVAFVFTMLVEAPCLALERLLRGGGGTRKSR